MSAMLDYAGELIATTIRQARKVEDVTILDLTTWIATAETHGAAFELAMLLDAAELGDLAHCFDLDPSGDRAEVAYKVTVHGRGLDEDEAADLRLWLSGSPATRRRATRALVQPGHGRG